MFSSEDIMEMIFPKKWRVLIFVVLATMLILVGIGLRVVIDFFRIIL